MSFMTAALPHLPALQVVLPLMMAPLCVLLRNRHAAFSALMLSCLLALTIALNQWALIADTGSVSYAIGNWAAPCGIEYQIRRKLGLCIICNYP